MEGDDRFPKELYSIEEKVMDIFVLFISIVKWNEMDNGSVPWNNEPVTVR